jgi:hypothetical protein
MFIKPDIVLRPQALSGIKFAGFYRFSHSRVLGPHLSVRRSLDSLCPYLPLKEKNFVRPLLPNRSNLNVDAKNEMELIDVVWTPRVNALHIQCDCGALLIHPSNYSVVQCRRCGRAELWHSV